MAVLLSLQMQVFCRKLCGSVGIMLDYHDNEAMITAYETMYDDENYSKKLIKKSLKRAKLFLWKNAVGGIVNSFMAVYTAGKNIAINHFLLNCLARSLF